MWPESPAPARPPAASGCSLCSGCWEESSSGARSSPPSTAGSSPHTHEQEGSGDHMTHEIWFTKSSKAQSWAYWREWARWWLSQPWFNGKTIPHAEILMQRLANANLLWIKVTCPILQAFLCFRGCFSLLHESHIETALETFYHVFLSFTFAT